ncbi:MAG: 1-acyl-sn-glycerol-3-phosphate acyltransferase [Isosphaeraceae bacterium]
MTRELVVILAVAVLLLAAFVYSMHWLVQPFLRLLLSLRYRFVLVGRENVPRRGPVLIAANHVSWLDGVILAATSPRRGEAMVNADYVDWPILGRYARWIGLIPVPISGPKAQRAMIETCRRVLDDGFALGIFPEAQISRNGLTGPFHRGLEVILSGREQVAVIPCFLDNLWGSSFSFSGGHFFRKRPRGLRRTVIVSFGPPVAAPVTAFAVRQAVLEAGVAAHEHRPRATPPLDTIDPALPYLDHPELGRLTGSTADVDDHGVRQTGHRPGTLGRPLPGVALQVVDDSGQPLGPEQTGRLQARVAGRPGWIDTGLTASIDRQGFVSVDLATV